MKNFTILQRTASGETPPNPSNLPPRRLHGVFACLLLGMLMLLAGSVQAQKSPNEDKAHLEKLRLFLEKKAAQVVQPDERSNAAQARSTTGGVELCDGMDNNGDGVIDAYPVIGGNVFLKGHYIEIGVAECGSFGSNVGAPAGYHPRGADNHPLLGYVADVGKDGWSTGANGGFCGDYFVPGSPEEGWGLTINGTNYNNNQLCYVSEIPGSIVSNSVCANEISLNWAGGVAGLGVEQYIHFPNDKLWWVIEVKLTNNTASTMTNIYYHRNVDPDQDVPAGGDFETTNTIVSQNPNGQNLAMVSALGGLSCYLSIGSKDPRARVTHGGFSNRSAYEIWNGIGLNTSGTVYADEAISIAFKVASLAPGESTVLKYAYMLDPADIDDALAGTSPFYPDTDGDGFGDSDGTPVFGATAPTGYVANGTDCDDDNDAINPDATDICGDGIDNNCDGVIDGTGDADGDGFAASACNPSLNDCNDNNDDAYPGAPEISCDGLDNNCDGNIAADEADADNDGYLVCENDCNDSDANVNPAATEVCNLIDDDCDGSIDEGVQLTFYADTDSDTFGDAGSTTQACTAPSGFVANDDDCDDDNDAINPDATDICGDGIDNNCDGVIDGTGDADGDGFAASACNPSLNDCDDNNDNTYPGAAETCDGLDNNCDGSTPANESDADNDGYLVCENDCNDNDDAVNPGQTEILANSIDDDCDGLTDILPYCSTGLYYYSDCGYVPIDDFTFGTFSHLGTGCSVDNYGNFKSMIIPATAGETYNFTATTPYYSDNYLEIWVDLNKDGVFDDTNEEHIYDGTTSFGPSSPLNATATIPATAAVGSYRMRVRSTYYNPDALPCSVEYYGEIHDYTLALCEPSTFYADADGDTYGDAGSTTQACTVPMDYVANDDDCDDTDADIKPGATEIAGDEVDQNCDGAELCFTDADDDGYRLATTVPSADTDCDDANEGQASDGLDCDDNNPAINPGATEACNDIDDNCDGNIDMCRNTGIALDANGMATLAAAAVYDNTSDNCSAPGTPTLMVSPSTFDCDDAGTATVTLTVTDAVGNTASCQATVTVLDVLHYNQEAQRMATDGLAGDKLGWGLGLSGQWLIAGAPDDKVGTQNKQGSAYAFSQNQGGTDNWGQVKQIRASDGATIDYFGNAVSMDGSTVIVGAHGDNVGTITDAGSAYIFEKDLGGPNNWGQRTNISARDGAAADATAYDYFGNAASLASGRALIGAHRKKVGTNNAQGAAYIYEKDAGSTDNWGNVKKLTASDGAANNFFGVSVAQSGDLALVGASGNLNNRGAVYVFNGSAAWAQSQKLTASDAAVGDGFGTSVSMTSTYALVGAPNKATYAGAAYVFKNNAGTWAGLKKLAPTAPVPAANDRFGAAVVLQGDYAYVSAVRGNANTGAVYVFHKDAGGADNWGQIGYKTATGGASGDQFGYSLAVSGERMALGANLDDVASKADQGSVYVFKGEDCPDMGGKPESIIPSQSRGLAVSSAVQCWPNPFRDELTIEIAQSGISNLASEIQVMDAVGRVMARVELPAGQSRHTLNTATLKTGLYFVQVAGEAGTNVIPVTLVR